MKYLKDLFNQFLLANGMENKNSSYIYKGYYSDEFLAFIATRQDIAKKYIDFLDYLGLPFFGGRCAEVGKSGYDSIVKTFNTTIITPFPITFSGVDSNRIMSGIFKVNEGNPVLFNQYKQSNKLALIPSYMVSRFITQNPYSESSILGWEDLHNSDSNITVGLYGKTYDKDFSSKIEMLKSFKDKLTNDEYIDDYAKDGDSYFYVIGSKKSSKTLRLR